MKSPFQELIDAAEAFREFAEEIYRSETLKKKAAPWPGRKDHFARKGKLDIALSQTAGKALLAAHNAGIAYDAAESRIRALVDSIRGFFLWAWDHRGQGSWLNRREKEDDDAYCERMAVTGVAYRLQCEHDALLRAFWECKAAVSRLGATITPADARQKGVKTENRTNSKPKRKDSCNRTMLETLEQKPESHGWTVRKWQEEIGFSISTIQGTDLWKRLHAEHEETKAERDLKGRSDRRRKARHYSRYHGS